MSDRPDNPIENLRILIVEDNPVNQHVTGKLMEKLGFSFVLAENGRDAIFKLESQEFDLILMDLMMPEMDGIETTRLIRSSDSAYASVPIIALTANVLPSIERTCRDVGMNDFMDKPVTYARMKALLDSWVGTIRADR
ncbi:MAG: response regulator [Endozoicomonas sp.]